MKAKYSRIVKVLLDGFHIKYAHSALERDFMTNPNNNNFYGLSQLFEQFGLQANAVQTNFEHASTLQKPFLVQLARPFGICAISKTSDGFVEGIDDKGNDFKYSNAQLAQRWSGNVMYVTPNEDKKVATSFITRQLDFFNSNLEIVLLAILGLFFAKSLVLEGYSLMSLILFVANFAGLIVSYQILKLKDPDFESKICTAIQKGDCKSITSSTKFLNLFDYDKIGIVYFLFFCAVPIFTNYVTAGPFLLVISSAAALFPFYSVYFQKYVEKKWCALCLIVQVCLIVNFTTLILSKQTLTFDPNIGFTLGLSFLLILVFANFYFSLASFRNDYMLTLRRLNRFIRNDDVFGYLLEKNESYNSQEKDLTIVIKTGRENEVVLVANPFCKHCSESYKLAKELISSNDSFSLKMIYLVGPSEIGRTICKQFISIYFKNGEDAYLKAVEEWYGWGFRNHKLWQRIYSIEEDDKADDVLASNENWAVNSQIMATPTILLNNRVIPQEYEIADFKYF